MFTWISIYQEIARHVLTLEERQDDLISMLKQLREKSLKVISLKDRATGDTEIELAEIDPFTFFATFNRSSGNDTRKRILEELKSGWGLQSDVPSDFDGIPTVDARSSWFFPYAAGRGSDDVPKLWRLAREAVEKAPEEFDRQALKNCLPIKTVALAKLTSGIFWLNPYNYLAVDSRNLKYLANNGIDLKDKSADSYFRLLEEVREKFQEDFPTISRQAYLSTGGEGGGTPKPPPTSAPRFWTLSAGHGGDHWQDFLDNGIIAIDWDRTTDLREFGDKEELRQKLIELWPEEEGTKTNDALACWQFVREMKPGDVVFAKQGLRKLLGVGRITGDYTFDQGRQTYKHVRKVKWLTDAGAWDLPEDSRVALKTLTDVTPYREFLERIAALTGVELPLLNSGKGGPPKPAPHPTDRRYWWLNANPKIWNFESMAVGETQTYTSHNEKGNKRQKYKYFGEVKPGDVVIGYVTSPQKEITAVCKVTKGLHTSADEGERIEIVKIEQLINPVPYEELKGNVDLAKSEALGNKQGSLFRITEDEYDFIRAIIDDKNPVIKPEPLPSYTKREALSELFLSEQELDDALSRLRRKKNIILQGPPGVGKTFVARRLAYLMMGCKDLSRVEMVQFHQSYAYEDFIQGYRPNEQGSFSIKPAIFYEFCRRAQRDPGRDYFFIVDEINRGNLSKIFGELMMLIEHDKRGPDFAIPLTYASSSDERFFIPGNLYLIGMMNTADRSLSLVDYALRRRFAFVTLHPKFASERFAQTLHDAGASASLVERIRERLETLNLDIAADEKNLGPGYRVGHSYFCPGPDPYTPDDTWYREVVESEIRPLLEEYWVDDPERVGEHINRLLN